MCPDTLYLCSDEPTHAAFVCDGNDVTDVSLGIVSALSCRRAWCAGLALR